MKKENSKRQKQTKTKNKNNKKEGITILKR